MKFIKIKLSSNEYEMLKRYAAARRKYEIGKGFTIDKAIAQVVLIGLDAISETQIVDERGDIVDWNSEYLQEYETLKESENSENRTIFRLY